MRVLEPAITCLVMSHMKPTLREALASLNEQTRLNDLQVIVVDSGAWRDKNDDISQAMKDIYDDIQHTATEWYFTGESGDARERFCPVSHWTNVALNEGLVKGRYFCTFYDDDVYYPEFMAEMAGYLDKHPEAMAVRCTENRTVLRPDGSRESTPPLVADREIPGGENMDCVVDGMQVMLRTEVIWKLAYPWFDENPEITSCSHSDGIFFNRLGTVIDKLHYIPAALCEHRNTQYSTFTPSI